MSRPMMLLLVAAVLALASCGILDGEDVGWFDAHLEGAVTHDYRGTGDFWEGRNSVSGKTQWAMSSTNSDTMQPSAFFVIRVNEERPDEGTYPLRLIPDAVRAQGGGNGFWMAYSHFDERRNGQEFYYAESGEVTITKSSNDRVVGTFRFVGFSLCRDGPDGYRCTAEVPATPPEGAPTIEVTGSFELVGYSQGRIIAEGQLDSIPS